MTLRVGYDCAPLSLNRAGEYRYARGLLGALTERDDLALTLLGDFRRAPAGGAQRIALQAAVQSAYYPVMLGLAARRAGVDLVHHPRHLVPRPRVGGQTTVVTIHDVLPLRAPELFSRLILANFRLLTAAAAQRAARVITGSAVSRDDIVELLGVDEARVVVTPYGLEPRFAPRPSLAALAALGIDGPYVLCVGTLEPRKNLATSLRAFERATRGLEEHRLVVVGGGGWGGAGLEDVSARLGDRVVQPGYVSDEQLVALLSGTSCFLYPSLFEGFGFPPLEAMACGAPVVAANRSSLPEVLGDAALLADPQDAEAVAACVRRVLTEPELAARLRERGLRRAAGFTWERCAAATAEVYREAVEDPR